MNKQAQIKNAKENLQKLAKPIDNLLENTGSFTFKLITKEEWEFPSHPLIDVMGNK